jgi:choline dehydrogenase
MPRVTTGNTMAACVIIGERAGELLRAAHKLSGAEAYSNQTPFARQTVPCPA